MKSIFKSKTIGFGTLVALAPLWDWILNKFTPEFFETTLGISNPGVLTVLGGIVVGLRFITNKGVSVSGK